MIINSKKMTSMKRTILLTMMTLCFSAMTWAQKTVVSNEAGPKEEAFDVVEQMPEFPGGMEAPDQGQLGRHKGGFIHPACFVLQP